jgi:hypothetical protein
MTEETEISESLDKAIAEVEQFAADCDDLSTLQGMKTKVDSLRSTLENRINALGADAS